MAAYRPIHCSQKEGHSELQGDPPEIVCRVVSVFSVVCGTCGCVHHRRHLITSWRMCGVLSAEVQVSSDEC